MSVEEEDIGLVGDLLYALESISDKEFQERVWIRAEGPECEDFDEAVERYSHASRYILKEYREYRLTESQYKILKEFNDKFEPFAEENYWAPDFIDSPEWAEIMEMAKGVLKAFDYKKES